jgi:hypothetical protein
LEIAGGTTIASKEWGNSKSNASQSAYISLAVVERGLSPDTLPNIHNLHLENSFIDGDTGSNLRLSSMQQNVTEVDFSPTELYHGNAPNKTPTKADRNDIVAGLKTWFNKFEIEAKESARELAIKRSHFAEAFAGLVEQQVKDQISMNSFHNVLRDIIATIDSHKGT